MFLRLIEELLNCPSNIVKDVCTVHVWERLGIILLSILHLEGSADHPTTAVSWKWLLGKCRLSNERVVETNLNDKSSWIRGMDWHKTSPIAFVQLHQSWEIISTFTIVQIEPREIDSLNCWFQKRGWKLNNKGKQIDKSGPSCYLVLGLYFSEQHCSHRLIQPPRRTFMFSQKDALPSIFGARKTGWPEENSLTQRSHFTQAGCIWLGEGVCHGIKPKEGLEPNPFLAPFLQFLVDME